MARTPSTMLALGTSAPSFELPDAYGKTISLEDFSDHKGLLVAFMCNHCPFVLHIADGFSAFAREYRDRGLAIVGINSNDTENYPADAPPRMREEIERTGYCFPYLVDESQEVARAYQAACTPDFFLFDAERRLVYRGQFDSSRPESDIPVTGEDLRTAADAVLEGRRPAAEQRPSLGCNIKWKSGNEPSYF